MKLTYGSTLRTGLVACMLVVLVLAGGCSERRSDQYRLEGDAYLGLGKYQEAIDSYHKAETANPKNSMAQLGLGRCLMAQQKPEEALTALEKAVELEPKLEQAYVQAASILLNQQRFDEAAALAQKLETANPERGGLLHALVLVRQGKAAEAVTLLTSLRDKFPKSADVRVDLAAALLATHEPDKAEPELRMVIDSLDPQNLGARIGLIDTYHAQGKVDAAVTESEKLSNEHPDSAVLKLGWARSLFYAKRFDEAEALAKKVMNAEPGSPWANFILGACLLQRNKNSEALPYLQIAENAMPERAEVRAAVAAARGEKPAGEQGGKADLGPAPGGAAAPLAGDWRGLWQQAAVGRLLEGRDTFLATNEPNVRETILVTALLAGQFALAEEVSGSLPEDSGFRQAVPILKESKLQDMITKFDAWNEQEPGRKVLRDNVYALGLARARARARALQMLSKCVETYPDDGMALYTMAMIFRDAKMHEFAARTYERLIAKYPNNSESHALLYQTLRESGSMRDAQRAAQAAYALFPTSPEVILNLAQASLDVKEADLAGQILEQAVKASPNNMAFQIANVATLLRLGKAADASKVLNGLAMPAGDSGSIVVFKALAAAFQDDWKTVAAVGEGGGADNPLAALIFAAANLKAGDRDKAVSLLEGISADKAKGDTLYAMLNTALGKPSDSLPGLDAELAAKLSRNTDALADFTFAAACQRAQLYDAASATLARLDQTLGDCDRFLQTYIMCLTRGDHQQDLMATLKTLTEAHKSSAVAWLGLAVGCRMAGDKDGEKRALEKAADVAPKDPEPWAQLAALAERSHDMKAAQAAYQHILTLTPDDPAACNNAAYCLLMNDGDVEQALALAQKAKDKMPGNPSIAHTLGVAQLRLNKLDDSRQNLAYALELRPGDPTLMLDYGKLLIAQGKKDEGTAQIMAALRYAEQLNLAFARKDEAKKLVGEDAPKS